MKKDLQFYPSTSIYRHILAICILILLFGCSKKNDPSPTNSSTPKTNNNNNNSTTTEYNTMCGTASDSICSLPYRIFSAFTPSGYYSGGDMNVDLLADSCGEAVSYAGQDMRIRYTKGTNWGWGASFLNNNNWTATYKISPTVTKITFSVKVDYSANVTFNAFGNDQYGKVELYKKANSVTPVWEKITINLSGKPATFAAPLSIIIDGVTTTGQVTIVDIRDLLFE